MIRSAAHFAGSYIKLGFQDGESASETIDCDDDIDWDAIFEIDFLEESDGEDENSDSENDASPVDEGVLFPVIKLGIV